VSSAGGIQHFFFAAAILLGISSLISIAIPNLTQPAELTGAPSQPSSRVPSTPSRIPLPPLQVFVFGSAIFLYIGVENALGGWLPSYAIRTDPTLRASSIAICFWVAELTGRILVTVLMTLLSEAALYRICLVLLILTQILLCATSNISPTGIIALTALAALSLAPIYPLIVSFLLARTGNHARLGALFATASFGGATLPWLTGVFSTQFHSLRTGLIVPAAGAALLLFLSSVLTAKPSLPSNAVSSN
jgi:fucose permease